MEMDEARTFIAKATWVWAKTYGAFAPHEYTTRERCREQRIEVEFEAFAALIESDGYWRPWGRHRCRSLDVDDRFYWLYWKPIPARERDVINRWWIEAKPDPTQLTLEVDDK
jgi:hypothetical protein